MNPESNNLMWLVFAFTYGVGMGRHAPSWVVTLCNLVSFVLSIIIIVGWVRDYLIRRRKKAEQGGRR